MHSASKIVKPFSALSPGTYLITTGTGFMCPSAYAALQKPNGGTYEH